MIATAPIFQISTRRPGPAMPRDATSDAITLGLQIMAKLRPTILAFNFAELGDIELPPETGSRVDQASLKTAAPLYLASELEGAGLYTAIELISGVFAAGSLTIPRGPTADRLARFWRGRRDRFSLDERQAYFARLFGAKATPLAAEGGSNNAFELLMVDLTEALFQYVEHPLLASRPGPRQETNVRIAARQLMANLIPRSGGMTPFAAEDLLGTAKEALEIMRMPDVQTSFGVHSVWDVVRAILRRYGQPSEHLTDHLTRGKSGMMVLNWLAESAPKLADYSSVILDTRDPVIAAAAGWLQASLSLATASPTAGAFEVGVMPTMESEESEIVVHTENFERRDKPLFAGFPLGAKGEHTLRFTIPNGHRFSRWQVTTIDSSPLATYEVKRGPARGAEGAQTLKVGWSYPPFGHIHLRIEAFASVTGIPGSTKIDYETAGWLDQCRDQLQQGAPFGIAVRGSSAEMLHAALQQEVSKNSHAQTARPFVTGVDDAIVIAVVAAVVLVVIAAMGFFVLHNILMTAMAKGYEVGDTSFNVGGGEGPTRVDSELVFNLMPPASG